MDRALSISRTYLTQIRLDTFKILSVKCQSAVKNDKKQCCEATNTIA